MTHSTIEKLPCRIMIKEIVSSRYQDHKRPLSWDDRREGVDVVRSDDGREVRLFSDGGQSPPKPGWIILVNDGAPDIGYRWTLYGMPGSHKSKTGAYTH